VKISVDSVNKIVYINFIKTVNELDTNNNKKEKIMTYNIKIKELMRTLKPVKTCNFMTACHNYRKEIITAFENGAESYEISGFDTKNGHPEVFFAEYYSKD
jgi:alpha-D-ribose 1-methylphosphonate 5-phosphate C-P lyase